MRGTGRKPTEGAAWRAAKEHGVDLSLLESNLGKTPAQRVRCHSRALAAAVALNRAVGKSRARPA